MQTSIKQVEELAGRIESAYLLRRPGWSGAGPSSTVWAVAAANLVQLHRGDPSIPIDPELFVACQPASDGPADPWRELARPAASRRYERRIRRIVAGLRDELRDEVARGLARARRGGSLEAVLASRSRWLSPLGRFILAHRSGRADLAEHFRAAAQEQHRSCPLYRAASLGLLRPDAYPVLEILPGMEFQPRKAGSAPQLSLN